MNLRIDLAYDGAPFHGFARQPSLRTVQGEIESALAELLHMESVASVGAGRTDAGVHALGQVVSVSGVPDEVDLERMRIALNALCGPSIAVNSCRKAADDFNARLSARSRTYAYAILERDVPDPFRASTTWRVSKRLDVDAMNEAAGHALGERDFRSFGRPSNPGSTTVRTLFELVASRHQDLVRIKARANSFIQQMVRSLVGTLVEVGMGARAPGDMPGILEARDRAAAGAVAPPEGLCLVSVEYDDGWSRPFDLPK